MKLRAGDFRKWLAAKPHDEIVGHNRDCHTCPIALYYADASGGCEVVIFEDVNRGGYVIDRGYAKTAAPWWASRFIFAVDGDQDGKITARRAIEILDQVA